MFSSLGISTCSFRWKRPRSGHVGQIYQIDQNLDHLDRNPPLWDAVQDLNSTDPTQDTGPTVDHDDYTAPTRQDELDHVYRSYRSGVYLSALPGTSRSWTVVGIVITQIICPRCEEKYLKKKKKRASRRRKRAMCPLHIPGSFYCNPSVTNCCVPPCPDV